MLEKPPKLLGIQFGRGLAACLVVLYHAGRMLTEPAYAGHPYLLTWLFKFGNAGVDFFFVLSGFIIFYVHEPDIGRPDRLLHYLWQRVSRVYPTYWVVTLLVIATLLVKQDWPALNPSRITQSILLLPGDRDPLLGVAWTLVHEVAFYAVFAIAIVSKPAGAFCAILALVLAGTNIESNLAVVSVFHTPYHYEFALGVFAAILVRRSVLVPLLIISILGLLGFLYSAWLVDTGAMSGAGTEARLWFGIASCLLIVGIAKAELSGRLTMPTLGAYFGAASYSIYLTHTLLIGWVAKLLFSLSIFHAVPVVTALLTCLFAVAGGCAFYSAIEKPLQCAIKNKAPVTIKAK